MDSMTEYGPVYWRNGGTITQLESTEREGNRAVKACQGKWKQI
jgi:hypothetical protein